MCNLRLPPRLLWLLSWCGFLRAASGCRCGCWGCCSCCGCSLRLPLQLLWLLLLVLRLCSLLQR